MFFRWKTFRLEPQILAMTIYLTQLIFLIPGTEDIFQEFEDHAIPLMEAYGGKILYRLRPTDDSFVSSEDEKPYEIHFMSFPSDGKLAEFLQDDRRLEHVHLKNASVRSQILVKGLKMG